MVHPFLLLKGQAYDTTNQSISVNYRIIKVLCNIFLLHSKILFELGLGFTWLTFFLIFL